MTSVSTAAVSAAVLYISLFAALEPLSLGAPTALPMPTPLLLGYFVIPYSLIIGIRNGGSDLMARHAALQIAATRRLLPVHIFAASMLCERLPFLFPGKAAMVSFILWYVIT